MAEKIELLVPQSLTTTGRGTVSFIVEIVGNRYRGWRRTCGVGGLDSTEFGFQPSGIAALVIPGDLVGRMLLTLRFDEPRTGRSLEGTCRLDIRRYSESDLHIHAERHEVRDQGVIYQPIEAGEVDTAVLEVISGEVRLSVELEEEPLHPSVSLADLTSREAAVQLPGRDDGIVRTLSLDVGTSVVAGRCYASQLRPEARRRLESLGQAKVHWVTAWDDPRVNQVSALLRLRGAGDGYCLEVGNLTDYSPARQPLEVDLGAAGRETIRPGEVRDLPLRPGGALVLLAGKGARRRELARFVFDEVPVGSVVCPLIRTERSAFLFPPEAGDDARTIRFLGAWVPIGSSSLEALLGEGSLEIFFPGDGVRLALELDRERRMVTVSSNEDLASGLD